MLGFMVTFEKKIKRKVEISQKDKRKEQRKARLNLYNYVLFTPFRVSPRCGRGWVAWILPTGGEGGFFMVTSHGGAGFWLIPKRRKKKEKLYVYTYTYKLYIYI